MINAKYTATKHNKYKLTKANPTINNHTNQGLGLLNLHSLISPLWKFSILRKYM